VRLHDLRHSYASVPASNGASLLVIGALLGHRNERTTKKYAHLLDDAVRAAADAASSQIAALLNGASPAANCDAVPAPGGTVMSVDRQDPVAAAAYHEAGHAVAAPFPSTRVPPSNER
jgi:hypothetical protein